MIITIKQAKVQTGDYGEYLKVEGIDKSGKPVTKNVSNKFKDKWDSLQSETVHDFKMVQKDGKWYIEDITPVGATTEPVNTGAPPPSPPKTPKETPAQPKSSPEIGLAYKELGEMIRAGIVKKDTPEGVACHLKYWQWLFGTLGITVEKKKGE